jgi:hypothetical protein
LLDIVRSGIKARPAAATRIRLCLLRLDHAGTAVEGRIETLAREALSLFRQVNEPRGEAEACRLLGQALQKRGSLPEALHEYDAARRILLRLTDGEPENADFQRDLLVVQTYIGAVFQAQGQLGDALREYQAYERIMRRLVQREPENTVATATFGGTDPGRWRPPGPRSSG